MPCALFGKLLAKRDFIAVNMPREVLLPWERWLQSGVASAKNELQSGWLKAYLEAPLWRFWLGSDICGIPVKGVFMSSMDGVGRHFPLTVFTFADPTLHFEAPSEALDQRWYVEAEDFLLGTIDAGEDYEAVLMRLAALDESPADPVREWGGTMLHGALISTGCSPTFRAGSLGIVAAAQSDGSSPVDIGEDVARSSGAAPSSAGRAGDGDPDARHPGGEGLDDMASVPTVAELANATGPAAGEPLATLMAAEGPVAIAPMTGDGDAPCFGFGAIDQRWLDDLRRKRSVWWTIGGHGMAAWAMAADGFPDPRLMSLMLTGAAAQTQIR